ncbi:MAG TPA: DUF2911 domain-containing protein [Cyclobacteriaceae bacterium]
MNLRSLFLIVFISAAFIVNAQTDHAHAATKQDTTKKSIPREEHAQIGEAHITILYTAPAVRNRIIWGGLIAYDQVWSTGAHKATSFEINHSFSIGGKRIPAGKYGIFTIPGKDKWTFILNKNWNQHLADDYDSKDDVTRITVAPKNLSKIQERLGYSIKELSETECVLEISWEKIKIGVPIQIN